MKTARRLFVLSLVAGMFSTLVVPSSQSVFAARPEKVKIFIAFKKHPGPNEIRQIEALGGRVKWAYKTVSVLAAKVPKKAVKGIRKNPKVAFVEPDAEVSVNDLEYNNVWGVSRIGGESAQIDGYTGAGVKVGIIDTGIDYTHPDLVDRYAGGYDFYNNDSDPFDDRGHGTHVAGTIAASYNGVGVVGVAPEAQLYALKVFGSTGSGSFSDVVAAVEWCMKNGIQVTNNSYGAPSDPGKTVKAVFDKAASAGIINVASAGNDGSGTDTVEYPAKFSSVIAVSATDSNDNLASYSSTGPNIELAAPGSSIYSTLPGGGYGYKSGTSMASPHVAGAAAVLYGMGTADLNGDGLISDDIRNLLEVSADDLGASGFDNLFGNGLVDVATAVTVNGQNTTTSPPADQTPTTDPPPAPIVMSIASISYAGYGGKNQNKHFDVAICILDDIGAPVAGASVTAAVDSSSGASDLFTGVTDSSGNVVFSVKNAGRGTWTTDVLDVSESGYVWDGLNVVNTYSK